MSASRPGTRHVVCGRRSRLSARREDRGVAAVELALFGTLLFALLALAAPLGVLLLDKIELENAAGAAVRFAVQTPDRNRPGIANGWAKPPSESDICGQAKAAYGSANDSWGCAATVADADPGADPVCTDAVLPGNRRAGSGICIHLHDTVDLGVFGSILSVAGLGSGGTVPIAASAVQRQE